MASAYSFDAAAMRAMADGLSVLDIPRLKIENLEEARDFVRAYGYDSENEEDRQKLWSYHRRAVTYLQSELLREGETVPAELTDPQQLGDILNLLVIASVTGTERQKWACAILKIMHIYVYLDNDLFSVYSSEIQEQILKPIQAHIHEDSLLGTYLGPAMGADSIILKKFEVKNFKTTASSVTKLLAKRELVALHVMDKVGIRIVTKHVYDVFRVLKYFLDNHIVSYAHNISDQTNNTLYPMNLFLETIEETLHSETASPETVDRVLKERLDSGKERAVFLEKPNVFSSQDYRFVKFVTRRLVRVPGAEGKPPLTFFYPYEVQIVDYDTHIKNTSGPGAHSSYKERQIARARERVFRS